MNYQALATITPQRQIKHKAGQFVHIHWDGAEFHLLRSSFSQLARVMENGSQYPFAEKSHYSVVQVDDDYRDVWINDTCLTLTRGDYRVLLNAVLTTETRLHGFRAPEQQAVPLAPEPTTFYALPATTEFHRN